MWLFYRRDSREYLDNSSKNSSFLNPELRDQASENLKSAKLASIKDRYGLDEENLILYYIPDDNPHVDRIIAHHKFTTVFDQDNEVDSLDFSAEDNMPFISFSITNDIKDIKMDSNGNIPATSIDIRINDINGNLVDYTGEVTIPIGSPSGITNAVIVNITNGTASIPFQPQYTGQYTIPARMNKICNIFKVNDIMEVFVGTENVIV